MKVTVTPTWVYKNLKSIKLIDASWYLPTDKRDTYAEYKRRHIPGAVFFDIDYITDRDNPLPHMAPCAKTFAKHVGKLGISNHDTLIIYDTAGLFSAARVWWLFHIMGHTKVFVMDGGLPLWEKMGYMVSDKMPLINSKTIYRAQRDPTAVVNAQQVLETSAQILDARPVERFTGQTPEPRPNMKSGHIPYSINIYFKWLLTKDARLKSTVELQHIFQNSGVNLSAPIITSCGSGITACILILALKHLNHVNHALYDGSWAEWGGRDDLPIHTK